MYYYVDLIVLPLHWMHRHVFEVLAREAKWMLQSTFLEF